MQIKVKLTRADRAAIESVCRRYRKATFVKERIALIKTPKLNKNAVWHALMIGALTTQQKSGPNSPVYQLLDSKPFKLSLKSFTGMSKSKLTKHAKSVLRSQRGVRFADKLARQIAHNHEIFIAKWTSISELLRILTTCRGKKRVKEERVAADIFRQLFKGIGPKQSRNVLQALGIMKYEIPIDSRTMKWIGTDLQMTLPVTPSVMSDSRYYEFILDIFQQLCHEVKIYPAIFDACVFVSFNK
jgi:thermostable 8-oxoguanine DNA glycosylase